jgi:hypothetical protein
MTFSLGFAVPTLGDRIKQLQASVQSIGESGVREICVVCPEPKVIESLIEPIEGVRITFLKELGTGAASAINQGLAHLIDEGLEFVSWLGDDDRLVAREFEEAMSQFDKAKRASLLVTGCRYLDSDENLLFELIPRQLDIRALSYLPSRVPQPGSVIRSEFLRQIGLLNADLSFAFDHDLMIRLKEVGKVYLSSRICSIYSWHSGSLSSRGLDEAVEEGHRVRLSHGGVFARCVSRLHISAYRVLRKWFTPRLH